MKKSLLSICMTALLATGYTVAHADTLSDIKDRQSIKVAIDLGNPPFGLQTQQLEPGGFDVHVAQLLAEDLGAKLEIVPTTGPNRIPFLTSKRADIVISTLANTPERAQVIDFSVPYAAVLNIVAAPKSMSITGPQDLAGKRIAATRGTTNDVEVTKVAPPEAQVVRFDDEATTLTSVTSGQIKVVAQNPQMVKLMNEKNPKLELEQKFVLKQIQFGIGVRKGDDSLREWVDEWIKTNLKNGKLNALYRQDIGTDLPPEITNIQ
ncbi:MAG: transporter substrate-binding domain-containing protein [Pusillimonas sp.]